LATFAKGGDLEFLGNRLHPVLGRDGFTVPLHKGRIHLDDGIATLADELGSECRRAYLGEVLLMVTPDIDLADDVSADEQGQCPVDGGPRNSAVQRP
jgi:hypothetical protein